MDFIQTLILSLVEGVSEFLPISSTGHLVLTTQILNIQTTEFVKSFLIIIQLGAILSVIFLYWTQLLDKKIWPMILTAFIPSAAVGFLFYKLIKGFLIGNSQVTVIALFLGGLAFIAVELFLKSRKQTKSLEKISLKNAFIIGLFQSISIIPGVSRAGATILGGLLLNLDRSTAARFSFILAVPTMLGATTLDILETKLAFSQNELFLLIVGFIASFVFALITVKLFIKYLQNHNFIIFGVYRILLAIIFYLIFLR